MKKLSKRLFQRGFDLVILVSVANPSRDCIVWNKGGLKRVLVGEGRLTKTRSYISTRIG